MGSNWDNFLKNLGEWHGSFTRVSPDGELLDSTPSILSLEGFENNQAVRFRLRRFGPGGVSEPPTSDYQQDYRSLGRQITFFETGAFSKGSIQLAPAAEFGGEYGFVAADRRLRLVQLYDRQGNLDFLTLIREFREGGQGCERPPLTVDQLVGQWQGMGHTVYADWTPSERYSTDLTIEALGGDRFQQSLSFGDRTITSTLRLERNKLVFEDGSPSRQILLLADGASCFAPRSLVRQQPLILEVGWLVEPNQRQRLIRSYNEKGEWISTTHVIEHKIG